MTKEIFKKLLKKWLPIILELDHLDFKNLNANKYDYWTQFLEKLVEEINGNNYEDLNSEDIDNYMKTGIVSIKFDPESETTIINCEWIDENTYRKCMKDPTMDLSECERSFEDLAIIKKWDEVEEEELEFWWDMIYRFYSTNNIAKI